MEQYHGLKAQLTAVDFVKSEIVKLLNGNISIEAQLPIATKLIATEDAEMKKKAADMLTALTTQLDSNNKMLAIWDAQLGELLKNEPEVASIVE